MGNTKYMRNAILVKDDSVKIIQDSAIYSFLVDQGFSQWKMSCHPQCNWIYISLSDRTYLPGSLGIAHTNVLGDHAITITEFMTIYRIYEKYNGLSPLDMSQEETMQRDERSKELDDKRRRFFEDISFEDYLKLCRDMIRKTVDDESEEYIEAIMTEKMSLFSRAYENHTYPEVFAYSLSLEY